MNDLLTISMTSETTKSIMIVISRQEINEKGKIKK